MSGWIVAPDAPALDDGWYVLCPESVKARFEPGRYVLNAKGTQAEWRRQ